MPSLSAAFSSPRRWYQVGDSRMRWSDQLREMADSTPNLHQPDVLRATLQRDSYLLLRGVLPPELVHGARAVVTSALHKQWQCVDTSRHPHTAAVVLQPSNSHSSASRSPPSAHSGVLLTGYQPVTHHPHTLQLLESPQLVSLLRSVTAAPVSTFHTKWVRVMSRGQCTDEHVDYYRFKRTACGMLTVWIPLGEYRKEDGVLAVCEGSHRLVEDEEREEEAAEERDRRDGGREEKEAGAECEGAAQEEKTELPRGYASLASSLQWATTDVRVGDVIIFDIRAIHASTANEGDVFRLSMDTRWQPTHLVPPEHKHSFRHFTP